MIKSPPKQIYTWDQAEYSKSRETRWELAVCDTQYWTKLHLLKMVTQEPKMGTHKVFYKILLYPKSYKKLQQSIPAFYKILSYGKYSERLLYKVLLNNVEYCNQVPTCSQTLLFKVIICPLYKCGMHEIVFLYFIKYSHMENTLRGYFIKYS